MKSSSLWRVPLLLAAIVALLAAMWAGLVRMGWQWPVWQPGLAMAHGPLMVSAFFGTLIAVERAVALGKRWPYSGPVMSGVGGVLLIVGEPGRLPALLLLGGSLVLGAVFGVIVRRHLVRYTLVMAIGALAWVVGNALWAAGWAVYQVVLWWAAFLVLTIAGERLELGRLARYPKWVENAFMMAVTVFLAGLALSLGQPGWGTRLAALGVGLLAVWLLRYDIARHTIRKEGLPRFAAVCLLSGYVWLLAAAGIGMWYGFVPAGPVYDAFLHSIFVGFVFAMIFAHAPIIFPAILGLPIRFAKVFYLPLVLLHASLLLRVVGDLALLPAVRMWGGLLNGVTILAFLGLTAWSMTGGRGKTI
jgi:hypothetical protein